MSIVGLSSVITVFQVSSPFGGGSGVGNLLILPGGMDVRGLTITTGRNGFQSLTCFIAARLQDSFVLYDKVGQVRVIVDWKTTTIWDGRLEDVAIVPGGVNITALGYWRAFFDLPYTSLWSHSGLDGWRPGIESEVIQHKPELYSTGTKETNRLSINLKKGGVYATGDDAFYMLYELPDGGSNPATYMSFDYSYTLPTNWTIRGLGYTSGWASSLTSNIGTGGGTASGTFTWDLSATPKTIVGFQVFNSSGSPYTNTSEEDAFFVRVDNLRVTAAGATIGAEDVVTALVLHSAGNVTQISTSDALIESPGVDLLSEVYEDKLPADILTDLAARGDGDTPWEVGVWDDRILHFRAVGSASRTWYVDLSTLNIERTIGSLYNSVYAVYQAEGGRNLRTAVSNDSASVLRHGLTRRTSISSKTTTSTEADSDRDTYLADHASPPPRARITLQSGEGIFDASGTPWPKFLLRAGDVVVIRNLPVVASVDIDRFRTFRVIETSYSVDDDQMTITPEEFIPTLDSQVAKLIKGKDNDGWGDREARRR